MLPRGITLHGLDRPEDEVSADFYVSELVPALGQRPVEERREAERGAVVHPVAALYHFNRLLRRAEPGAVFIHIFVDHRFFIHSLSSGSFA